MDLPLDPRLLALLVIVLILVIATKTATKRGKSKRATSYPYVAVNGLFTAHERAFLGVLEQAAGNYRVFGKVRVADVIEVRKGIPKREWQGAFNRVSQKHLDFVLCHPHDLRVWCAVELDDKTHRRADRKSRDDFLEKALMAAAVPLVRVSSKHHYNVSELRALLATHTILEAA